MMLSTVATATGANVRPFWLFISRYGGGSQAPVLVLSAVLLLPSVGLMNGTLQYHLLASAFSRDPVLSFNTPDNNIHCLLTQTAAAGASARCQITTWTYTPPPQPATCLGLWGSSVIVNRSGAIMECPEGTVVNQSVTTLADGETKKLDGVTCVSLTAGVRCTYLPSRHGFQLASQAFSRF